eukprot:gb/GEZN01006031.1/.p1 GENE.gb/GEZN01006031.1/~~gb/GEZN01006031.1/.p1  ORF type:complete len:499 (-),score=88.92 gb/GEZN01006031.1/:223-1575(-)
MEQQAETGKAGPAVEKIFNPFDDIPDDLDAAPLATETKSTDDGPWAVKEGEGELRERFLSDFMKDLAPGQEKEEHQQLVEEQPAKSGDRDRFLSFLAQSMSMEDEPKPKASEVVPADASVKVNAQAAAKAKAEAAQDAAPVRITPAPKLASPVKPEVKKRTKPPIEVICAIKDTEPRGSSTAAFNWLLNDPMDLGKINLTLITIGKSRQKEVYLEFLRDLKKRAQSYGERFVVTINFREEDWHGVGHTMKVFLKERAPELLVVGKGRNQVMAEYWSTCDSPCPVVMVKSRLPTPSPDRENTRFYYKNVALTASPRNKHVINSFHWMVAKMDMKHAAQMIVVHVVTSSEAKASGREYINTFRPLAKGLPFLVRSALVCASKDRTIEGGLKSFIKLKDQPVDLCVVSPKPADFGEGRSKTRVGGAITAYCVDNLQCDILIFKDSRTRSFGME